MYRCSDSYGYQLYSFAPAVDVAHFGIALSRRRTGTYCLTVRLQDCQTSRLIELQLVSQTRNLRFQSAFSLFLSLVVPAHDSRKCCQPIVRLTNVSNGADSLSLLLLDVPRVDSPLPTQTEAGTPHPTFLLGFGFYRRFSPRPSVALRATLCSSPQTRTSISACTYSPSPSRRVLRGSRTFSDTDRLPLFS